MPAQNFRVEPLGLKRAPLGRRLLRSTALTSVRLDRQALGVILAVLSALDLLSSLGFYQYAWSFLSFDGSGAGGFGPTFLGFWGQFPDFWIIGAFASTTSTVVVGIGALGLWRGGSWGVPVALSGLGLSVTGAAFTATGWAVTPLGFQGSARAWSGASSVLFDIGLALLLCISVARHPGSGRAPVGLAAETLDEVHPRDPELPARSRCGNDPKRGLLRLDSRGVGLAFAAWAALNLAGTGAGTLATWKELGWWPGVGHPVSMASPGGVLAISLGVSELAYVLAIAAGPSMYFRQPWGRIGMVVALSLAALCETGPLVFQASLRGAGWTGLLSLVTPLTSLLVFGGAAWLAGISRAAPAPPPAALTA